jgi:hypothetical protein
VPRELVGKKLTAQVKYDIEPFELKDQPQDFVPGQ